MTNRNIAHPAMARLPLRPRKDTAILAKASIARIEKQLNRAARMRTIPLASPFKLSGP
jgi:hypothetical protein